MIALHSFPGKFDNVAHFDHTPSLKLKLQNEKQIDRTTLFHVVFAKTIFMGREKNKGTSQPEQWFQTVSFQTNGFEKFAACQEINSMTIWLKTSKPTSARNF